MGRPSTASPEILAKLEPYLENCMTEWNALPEDRRKPNLPNDKGKINVSELVTLLGFKAHYRQYFNREDPQLRTLVNVAAEKQGLDPIRSQDDTDADDEAVRKKIQRISAERNELSTSAAEREAVIERQRREIASLRAQLGLRDDTGMLMRKGECGSEALRK